MQSRAYTPVWSMPAAAYCSSLLGNRNQALLALLLPFVFQWVGAAVQNPRDNFCRRFGHQTTVIDDKLYIDGGFVNFDTFSADHLNVPNTWLGFQDLNNLTTGTPEAWPQLNISLSKDPNLVPTVHGGVLWGDSVNKNFFVFGGEYTVGLAQNFHVFSYDILYDKWDDLGSPTTSVPLNIASYGAGVGVSETGQGYYYGGWISNASMYGFNQERTMSSDFYRYEYDTNKFTPVNSPADNLPRAEGVMVWIPAGDTGLLVYFGGIVSPNGNGTQAPQPFDEILVFDPSENAWFTQKATGEIPGNRSLFCADAAWAPDRSSYNIYMWGGLSVSPPVVNVTAPNNAYILSIPSFTWVKAYPDHHGNGSAPFGHYSASCNMVKSNSQMIVIGGVYPGSDMCDLASTYWAQHNFWTGTLNNDGDNDTYWALFNPNVTSNVVPVDVYSAVGGDKNGNATLLSPKSGYDSGNDILGTLLARKPTFATRAPTRPIATTSPTASPTPPPPPPSSGLSTGAIVGIAIGSAAGLGLLVLAWYLVSRRARRRRQERAQSEMTQASDEYGAAAPSVISPLSSRGTYYKAGPVSPQFTGPPAELDTGGQAPRELDTPLRTGAGRGPGSPEWPE